MTEIVIILLLVSVIILGINAYKQAYYIRILMECVESDNRMICDLMEKVYK